MKKSLAIAAMLVATVSFAQANMLVNAGFEIPGSSNQAAHWDSSFQYPHAATGWAGGSDQHPELEDTLSFLNGDPADGRQWTMQTLSSDETLYQDSVRAGVDHPFQPNTTYTFDGWIYQGSEPLGEMSFEIGYLSVIDGGTNMYDLNSFVPLASMSYTVTDLWRQVDGVTYTTGDTGPELGLPITVKVRALDLTGGSDDIWYDAFTLTPEPTSLLLLSLGLLLRRR